MSTEFDDLPQVDNYRELFLRDTPLLDVRAPVEFEQGAFPHTINVPLINDEERTEIGIRYKQQGQDAAIELGHQLVQGETKAQRVEKWAEFVKQYPQGVLYCFRGGMRSKITQQWIYDQTGIVYPRVKGGYKALRRFLIDTLEESLQQLQPVLLSGRTGSGKTLFLQKLVQQVDLEGIYHHRGSVFGKHVTPQPAQIDIENQLSIALLKLQAQHYSYIVLEDEGGNIGSRRLPEILIEKMKQAPVVVLEVDTPERIDIIFQEYIIESLKEHQQHYNEAEGWQHWQQQLFDAVDKIRKRLGGQRHKILRQQLEEAMQQHRSGNIDAHRQWIETLLIEYYDPMYDFQLEKKSDRVVFKGKQDAVVQYLAQHYQVEKRS